MGSCEQRIMIASYADITLLFAVPEADAKCADSRNGLCIRELRGIIRGSQMQIEKVTLFFSLFCDGRLLKEGRKAFG